MTLSARRSSVSRQQVAKLNIKTDRENYVPVGVVAASCKPVCSKIPRISVLPKLEPTQEPMSFSTQSLPAGVEDIDKEDECNVMLATDYVVDIYKYMRNLEVGFNAAKLTFNIILES